MVMMEQFDLGLTWVERTLSLAGIVRGDLLGG